MGLLDDLKKQAEAKKQQLPFGGDGRPQQYLKEVHSALLTAVAYFMDLAQTLNVLKPDVRRRFYIEGGSKLSDLLQGEYTSRDHRKGVGTSDYLVEARFLFTCTGNDKLYFEKESRQAGVMKEYLWAYGVPFETKDIRDSQERILRTAITVLSRVPASIILTGNWDTGQFHLTLRNVEVLGEVKYTFELADITNDFLEEIGKVVLAQPNQLRNFGRSADAPLPASFAPPKS